jgi:hypothetical protein
MDNQKCDRHPSARAQARVLLPSLRELFFCGHCIRTMSFGDDFFVEYEMTTI